MPEHADTYLEGIVVNHRCQAAVILENHRWFDAVVSELPELHAERIKYWSFDHELLLIGNVLVSVGQGASVVAALAERFRISGARQIVRIASTGSLQPEVTLGDVVVPYSSVRDEGTSSHYLPADVPAVVAVDYADSWSKRLAEHSITVKTGMVWTTDGRWKETDKRIAELKRLGCLAVDMETAGLYAFGMDRKLPVISLNIVKDCPHEDTGRSFDFRGIADRRTWSDTIMPLFLKLFQIVVRNLS